MAQGGGALFLTRYNGKDNVSLKSLKTITYRILKPIKIIAHKRGDRSMPDYTLQPFPMPYQCNISQNLISYFDLARSAPIKKPYSLHQSALVGGQNAIWILGLYHFVSEEFDHNVANYISS